MISVQASVTARLERFSEADEDEELLGCLFADIDQDKNGTVSRAELEDALRTHGGQAELRVVLESLIPTVADGASTAVKGEITREAFYKAVQKLPRVRGERVKWARGLGLDGVVARLLPRGDIFDGLKGLRAVTPAELPALVSCITDELASVLPALLQGKIRDLQEAGNGGALSHVNSKFCLDGAFVGRFATLDDFHRGPEELIGTPNPRIEEGMAAEHCRRANRDKKFTTSNYNVLTWPSLEWEFVVAPKEGVKYPHTPSDRALWEVEPWSDQTQRGWKGQHGRDPIGLDAFFPKHPCADELLAKLPVKAQALVKTARKEIVKAGLLRGEVIGIRLYTGPLFVLYNAVLRCFPAGDVEKLLGNRYETTIFVITSAITKVSKVSEVPTDRLLFRGCGGMILPRQFWDAYDECTVFVVVHRQASGETAEAAMDDIQRLLFKLSERPWRKGQGQGLIAAVAAAYDMDTQYLQLPLAGLPDAMLDVVAKGIRIAIPPQPRDKGLGGVSLALALPVTKVAFEERLFEPLRQALGVACSGRALDITHVAAKPRAFRGGGSHPPIAHRPPPTAHYSAAANPSIVSSPSTGLQRTLSSPVLPMRALP
jgi:hypothetical protein